jgi:two-component system, response regulator PdtaR
MVPQPLLRPSTARILVVEDEVLICAVIAEELRAAGFSVIEAGRADEALAYIKAGEQVDLVFSDIQTPGSLNGLQLAKTLRDKYPDIPVILTSGNALPYTTSRKQSHSYPRSWLKSPPVNHHERSLHLNRRGGLARENTARGVSSRVWLLSAGGV